ncbi:bestrophin-like domain [Pedobacter nyackensis]|uniref:DUF4239 domain-containing protein n=1 Tax=Pedobacter nyackensis TaxID=475255 RepID=A0A1W2AN81_9SPHI|nr:DUF4239 domain-containing protein [Pedobacter nyackensis]SMC61901.1 Protein of unknown function [Pedobacter nyackensis]
MVKVSFLEMIGMFMIPFSSVLIPLLLGKYYGLFIRAKSGKLNDSPIGSVVGSALGLLAFMLAFTFQIVDTRYSSRKELLLDEVTTIRTTYLQAGLIPEPYRSATRKHLVTYTDVRVDLAKDMSPATLENAKLQTQIILDSLWSYSEALAVQDRSSEAYSLYISSVNGLVEIYNKRIVFTFEYRIPVAILWVLFVVTVFSMFLLGYHLGISGKKSLILAIFIAIIFASVVFLILSLDRPESQITKLNQAPMATLYKELHVKEDLSSK